MTSIWLIAAPIGVVVLAVLRDVLTSLAADEAKGMLKRRGRSVLTTAAERLPEHVRDRYLEEWLAEHASLADTPIAALRWARRVRSSVPEILAGLNEPAQVGRIEQRRRRREARRQLRLEPVRKHLAGKDLGAALDTALRERGLGRLAALGAVVRESGASRIEIARMIAQRSDVAVSFAEAVGRSTGFFVGSAIQRWTRNTEAILIYLQTLLDGFREGLELVTSSLAQVSRSLGLMWEAIREAWRNMFSGWPPTR